MQILVLSLLFAAVLMSSQAFLQRSVFPSKSVASVAVRASSPLAMTIKLIVDENEPIEEALKRFKRAVNQSGHLMTLRHKEMHETVAEKKKRKRERARVLDRMERTNDRYERMNNGGSEYNS